ncbi:MAG: serine/threonine-protein kinase [Ktedonobacterales bacterium]
MARSEGAVIGPYRLVRSLGRGGAGEVWLASGPAGPNSPAGGDVAVKLLAGAPSDPAARSIAQQAGAASRIPQLHILPFYGVVEQEDTLALAMAYAPGGSLGDALRSSSTAGISRLSLPLAPSVVARLITQLARTLGDAHAAGLVHGDLKPANIFVRTAPSGQPLAALGDFGQSLLAPAAAAIAARGSTSRASADSWAAQQLLFAAPEQLMGQSVAASDQYSLAAVAYLLLTGQPPFSGDAPALAAAIARRPAAPPTLLNPELSPEAERVLLRALEKDPGARFQNVTSFAAALDEALAAGAAASGVTQQFAHLAAQPGTSGSRLVPPVPGASGVRLTLHPRPSDPDPLSERSRSLRRPLTIVAIFALLVVVLATALAFRAVDNAAGLPHITANGRPARSTSVAATPNPTVPANARDAERELAAATGHAPVFSDPLSSNAHHWPTAGKTVFFGAGGLHVLNTDAQSVIVVQAPTDTTALGDLAAKVDLTFVSASPGNFAGLRFFISPDGSAYYSFAIALDGRYQVWLRTAQQWTFVNGGYTSAITNGIKATNTLAVVAHGGATEARFFINGHFVTAVRLSASGPSSGDVGLIVLDNPTEAVYANFAAYDATGR